MENRHLDPEYRDKLESSMKCASIGRPSMAECGQANATRPPDARGVLLAHAEGLREEAHRLETLARALPPLPAEADRVLYELAIHRRSFTR